MSDITLSKAVRSNLLNLQSTAGLLSKSQERLSTGLRVNSALDNPTNFFTAQGLNSRANDLSQLLDSVSNAVQTVAAADKGITAITKLVESAQATARQALQTAATTVATAGVNAVATSGNTTALTITSSVAETLAAPATGNLTGFTASAGSSVSLAAPSTGNLTSFTASAGSPADAATLVQNAYTPVDLSGVNTLTFDLTVDGTPTSVSLDNSITAVSAAAVTGQELADAINAQLGGGTVATFDTGSGNLVFTSSTVGTGSDVTVATVAGTAAANSGIVAGNDTGADLVADTTGSFTVNGQNVTIAAGDDVTDILSSLNTAAGLSSGSTAFTVSNASGTLTITGTAGNDVTVAGLTTAQQTAFGLSNVTTNGDAAVADTTGSFTVNGQNVTIAAGDDVTDILSSLNTAAGLSSGSTAFTVSNASGTLTITGTAGNDVTVAGLTTAQQTAFGLTNTTTNGTAAVTGTDGAFTINGQTVTLAGGDDAAAILGKLQTAAGTSTGTNAFTVSNNAGVLSITGTAGNDVVIGGLTSGQSTALGLSNGTTDGTPAVASTANPKRAELVETYNDLLGQIDALAKDSGFNGVNLLGGDNLSVLFNEDGSSKLDITGVGNSSTGLGLTTLASSGFDTNASINSTLDDLKASIDTLRSQSAKFGSNLSVVETRQDFTKNMINVLQTGAANLTLADTNEEAANVLALQTRQQLSSTALSLASQADQNVLRLF